ncbi:MAG: hypothetical protein ACFFBD_28965, partial [Candidatus Hodarchaeota archaeon]
MTTYQGARISPEEVAVLELIEQQIGEPIPYLGTMSYGAGNYFSSYNPPNAVDPDAYGSNPDEFYATFGFSTRHGHVTELGVNGKSLTTLPASFGDLKWLKVLKLEHNNLEALPESMGDIKELFCVYLAGNALKSLPANFKVQIGDPFGVFQNGGTNLDIRGNPLKLASLLVLLKINHHSLSTQWPDRIYLHQSEEQYDYIFTLVPNELFLHPLIQGINFASLKILNQYCSHCQNSEVMTGRLKVTQQDLVFCPICERKISITPISTEIQETLTTQLGQLENETGLKFPKLKKIVSATFGYTGDPDHITGLGFFKANLREIPESIG